MLSRFSALVLVLAGGAILGRADVAIYGTEDCLGTGCYGTFRSDRGRDLAGFGSGRGDPGDQLIFPRLSVLSQCWRFSRYGPDLRRKHPNRGARRIFGRLPTNQWPDVMTLDYSSLLTLVTP